MKKSILLGCIAACALSATVASADTKAPAVVKPTADEMKTAFAEFINENAQVGTLLDLNKITVKAVGNDFDVTLPAFSGGDINVKPQTIRLTYAGGFNDHAQYKIETPFESIQSLFKNVLPEATLNTESADIMTVWAPAYNLVTKSSQNIKGLKLSIPNTMDFSMGSLASDTLVRVISSDKMDAADTSDGQDVRIVAENAEIIVPSFSYESALSGSDITSDPVKQMLSCNSNVFKYSLPDIQLKMQGSAAPIASFSLQGQGSYQNEIFHFENKIGNITSPTLGAFAPAALIPDEISINLDVEGISKDVLAKLAKKAQDKSYTDEDVPALKQAIETGVIKLNLFEAKNSLAGMALSGTIRGKLKNAETVKTLLDVQANLIPIIDAKVVITNFDKISPEPKVDQLQCDRATERLNSLDMSAPNAIMQKETAEMQKEIACAPQGGPLDMLRPYLDLNERVVDTAGETKDTFVITFEDDVLTINGKQAQ